MYQNMALELGISIRDAMTMTIAEVIKIADIRAKQQDEAREASKHG